MIWPKEEFTRFEVARLVGARSLQIALGAPVLVSTDDMDKKDSFNVAKQEFRKKMIPITVKREMPDRTRVSVEAKKAIQNWMDRYNGDI
jgi:DNA-directed RNA polymerase subunit K